VKLQTEALGGTVEVKSEMNRYTVFTVYLQKPENVTRQLLYQEPYAEIFYDARINSVGTIWHGPVTSEQYRSAFKKCLEFVKVYNTPNYFADLTEQGPIDREDQYWMFSEIMPEAARNGLKRIAIIWPDSTTPHAWEYIKNIADALSTLGIWQITFSSMEEGMDWIQEENEKATLKIKA